LERRGFGELGGCALRLSLRRVEGFGPLQCDLGRAGSRLRITEDPPCSGGERPPRRVVGLGLGGAKAIEGSTCVARVETNAGRREDIARQCEGLSTTVGRGVDRCEQARGGLVSTTARQ